MPFPPRSVEVLVWVYSPVFSIRYGLDGQGIETRWGRDFSHLSRQTLGPTQPPIKWVTGVFPVGKAAVAWRGVALATNPIQRRAYRRSRAVSPLRLHGLF